VSVQLIGEVLEHSRSAGTARVVMVVIADNANYETREAWPSIEEIARRANANTRTVQRCLHGLIHELCELEVVQIGGGRKTPRRGDLYAGRTTVYRLPQLKAQRRHIAAVGNGDTGTDCRPEGGISSTPLINREPSLNRQPPEPPRGGRRRDRQRFEEELAAWSPHPAELDDQVAPAFERVRAVVVEKIARPTTRAWLAELHPHEHNGRGLVLGAPADKREWIVGRFGALLEQAAGGSVVIVPCEVGG
jgi:hypothetical protein